MSEYNLPVGKLCIYKIIFNYSTLSIGAYHNALILSSGP